MYANVAKLVLADQRLTNKSTFFPILTFVCWPFFPKNYFLKVFKGLLLLLSKCLRIVFGFEKPTAGCIFCSECFQNERENSIVLKKIAHLCNFGVVLIGNCFSHVLCFLKWLRVDVFPDLNVYRWDRKWVFQSKFKLLFIILCGHCLEFRWSKKSFSRFF